MLTKKNLTRLEEEDRHLAQVEVDEVLRLVRHVRAEVATNDAVPGGVVLFVELLFDESSNVLLDVVLLESLGRAVDSILLHVLGHVSVLDHGLAVSHGESSELLFLHYIIIYISYFCMILNKHIGIPLVLEFQFRFQIY